MLCVIICMQSGGDHRGIHFIPVPFQTRFYVYAQLSYCSSRALLTSGRLPTSFCPGTLPPKPLSFLFPYESQHQSCQPANIQPSPQATPLAARRQQVAYYVCLWQLEVTRGRDCLKTCLHMQFLLCPPMQLLLQV